MAGTDIIGGGNIEPRALEDEMRSAYLDYAMSVIVGRALPDVRDGLKPVHRRVLFSMSEIGLRPDAPAREVRGDRRRRDGQVPPARRPGDLRHARAHGAGLLHALPRSSTGRATSARSTTTPPRPCATPRRASRAWRWRCCATSTRTRSTSSPTYDGTRQEPLVLPSRFPNLLVNGSTGIAVGMATNIPPHNLREVADAVDRLHRRPADHGRRADGHVKGPDFPTGGIIVGRQGIRDAYETGRGRVRVRARVGVEEIGQGKEALIVTELPYAGEEGRRRRPHHQDRRPRPRQEAARHHRPARRVRPPRHAPGHRAQARRAAQGRAQPALQAHRDAVDVRREHGRAGRRDPAHAVAARGHLLLRQPSARGHRPAHEVRALREGAPRPHPRGTADRDRQPRRGHRADPRLARPRERPHRADGSLRALARCRRRRSSTCACRSSPRWSPTRSAPSTPTSSSASRSCARSSATRRASWASSRRS